MLRSTAVIKLALVGTAASLVGFEAFKPSASPFNGATAGGGDFGEESADGLTSSASPTSQPSGSVHRSYYGHSHPYWWSSLRRSAGGWSSTSSSTGTSSGSHVGTSRGGFGSSGHAAGS